MGIKVTIVDDSEHVGFAASATRVGELYMTSVADMVSKILAHLASYASKGSTKMSRLNILDHGNATGIEIGTDWVTTANFSSFQPVLAQMSGCFDKDGFTHLQHCEAGANLRLMEMFADALRVPILAGRGLQNPVLRFNLGNFVRVYPAGPTGSRRENDTFFWGPSDQ